MKAISLIGFMGAGKTFIGEKLAEKNGFQFFDVDNEIVKLFGSISEIFRTEGELYFRQIERDTFKRLISDDTVISTGGGLPTKNFNIQYLKLTECVFLDAPFETCYSRIKDDVTRPLVMKSDIEDLKNLYAKRLKIYSKVCDFTVDASLPIDEIISKIEDWYFNRED